MNLNERNRSKECQMCEGGMDETVMLIILECSKYDRDRLEIMRVIETKRGRFRPGVSGLRGCVNR